MRRVQRGDREAFTLLVDKYKQPVLNFILRTVRDEAEAEDLAQNVFVQVWRSAGRYRVTARFSTWLFTIARNLSLNELRRRARHRAESLDATHPEAEGQPIHQPEDRNTATPPQSLLERELTEKIGDALADLPEKQRTAILLCREEELSYEDIATVLGVTVPAVKSLIHRGRETLRARLKTYLRTGQWREGR